MEILNQPYENLKKEKLKKKKEPHGATHQNFSGRIGIRTAIYFILIVFSVYLEYEGHESWLFGNQARGKSCKKTTNQFD